MSCRPDQNPTVRFVDPAAGEVLSLPPFLARLRPLLDQYHVPVYLVGGAVRDSLLGRVTHDLDFIVPQQAVKLAFHVANTLNLPAYVLDRERDTGRVVLPGKDMTLDFASFRGNSLEEDLQDRDFTINAIALPATSQSISSLIDPCGGTTHLANQQIQLTHPEAIKRDPVRALRGVRLALNLDFTLTDETVAAITGAGTELERVSSERIRDELQRLLQTASPHLAVAQLDQFGLLDVILPEIAELRELPQSAPHHEPGLAHTISVLRWLALIEAVVSAGTAASTPPLAGLQATISPYVPSLQAHLARKFDGGLAGGTLLRLGALFHDAGKKQTSATTTGGQIRFIGHEKVGADLAADRLRQLCLSNQAIAYVKQIVAGHMRPWQLSQRPATDHRGTQPISRRAIYRFFRDSGPAGIDIGLISLADHLAIYKGVGDPMKWRELVHTVMTLLHHYFNQHAQTIAPPPLINGRDLIQALALRPGPEIGRLLRLIQEAQAAGEIANQVEAIQLARRHLSIDR